MVKTHQLIIKMIVFLIFFVTGPFFYWHVICCHKAANANKCLYQGALHKYLFNQQQKQSLKIDMQ